MGWEASGLELDVELWLSVDCCAQERRELRRRRAFLKLLWSLSPRHADADCFNHSAVSACCVPNVDLSDDLYHKDGQAMVMTSQADKAEEWIRGGNKGADGRDDDRD